MSWLFTESANRSVPDFDDLELPLDDPVPWVAATARILRAHVLLNYGRGHEQAGDEKQAQIRSSHGRAPPGDRSRHVIIGDRPGYSHSISENAAVAFRAL